MPRPYIQELLPCPDVTLAFRAIADWPNVILFDSSGRRGRFGSYSFLTAEPFELFEEPVVYGTNPFERVTAVLESLSTPAIEGLPPFQGGAAGLLTYELGGCFEHLPKAERDVLELPGAVIGLYDWTLAWDHDQGRCWFIGHGFPEETDSVKQSRAETQYRIICTAIANVSSHSEGQSFSTLPPERDHASHQLSEAKSLSDVLPELKSNFTRDEYLDAVSRVRDYIVAGDIFQANLSQQFSIPARRSPLEQYLRLRKENPAPFAGYFTHDDWAVMSSSPERFLQQRGNQVSTRPIKGTRRRRRIPEADLFTRDELRESEKDRAENVMIVDLLRNDLSRVCRPGTVKVPELCQVEMYETVAHLVSEVTGQLRPNCTFWDLLRATFPGGSITGAPKIRAMEIITELERTTRGPYCGSLFYHGYDGTADSNILIRTMTQRGGQLTFPAGGGIVAQSQPEDEYQETLHKARGLMNSLKDPSIGP